MKLYMKLILGILGLLMATANYAQVVQWDNVIDATGISDDQPEFWSWPTSVDGTNYTIGSDNFLTNLGHWNYCRNMRKKIEIDGSDSFSDNWLDAANTCTNRGDGWRLATIVDFMLVAMLKTELEQNYNFDPLRKGERDKIPSFPGEKGWHYWLATEVLYTDTHSYMMVFNDAGHSLGTSILYNNSSKAGIISDAGHKIQMPFRCVRGVDRPN